ncbi:MAG: response regulator [Magnetococcales bacterium]|nr:response regulator [Magnetococcales bacterium]
MEQTHKKRILIVEDESIVAMDLQVTLEDLGYAIIDIVAEGERAVDVALRTKPDIILMDIQLQGKMRGTDAAMHILKQIDIPIIYLTAFSDRDTRKRATFTEPYSYLIKPIDETELSTNIELALINHGKRHRLFSERNALQRNLQISPTGVIAVDPANGRIVFINTTAEQITGWSSEQACGKLLDEVYRVFDTGGGDSSPRRYSQLAATITHADGQNAISELQNSDISGGKDVTRDAILSKSHHLSLKDSQNNLKVIQEHVLFSPASFNGSLSGTLWLHLATVIDATPQSITSPPTIAPPPTSTDSNTLFDRDNTSPTLLFQTLNPGHTLPEFTVRTLGNFIIECQGQPLQKGKMGMGRPMQLLLSIIARGGREVPAETIMDQIWPDSEGDNAKRVFDSTLHRLRKVIGKHEALILKSGRISINPSLFWLDTWALESTFKTLSPLLAQHISGTSKEETIEQIIALGSAMITLYGGHFLDTLDNSPFTEVFRDTLERKYIRHAQRLGKVLMDTNRYDHALEYLQRAREVAPLSEELCHQTMLCLEQLNRPNDATTLFNAYSALTESILSTRPSDTLTTLNQRLMQCL